MITQKQIIFFGKTHRGFVPMPIYKFIRSIKKDLFLLSILLESKDIDTVYYACHNNFAPLKFFLYKASNMLIPLLSSMDVESLNSETVVDLIIKTVELSNQCKRQIECV